MLESVEFHDIMMENYYRLGRISLLIGVTIMYLAASNGNVSPDMTPIAEWLGATNPENFLMSFMVMYVIINVLSILVFNLGFARKLPVLKTVVVYAMMFFGNIFMTFLALSLPIIESLFIAALVLGIYKLQLRRHKKEEQVSTENKSSS